jgi:diguanylate cyclase (GGDEF)-like protein
VSRPLLTCAVAAGCALFPLGAAALDPARAPTQYVHSVWQTNDGLPQNTVTSVAQTTDGYLWLGTRGGLARFDGVRFAVYDDTTTPELAQSQILSLLADPEGRLWIGTWGGGLARLEDGRFTRLSAAQGLPSELVTALARDTRGRLWVGTDGGGVGRLEGDRFVAVASRGALGVQVRALAAAPDGMWVGTDAGLAHLADGDALTSYGTAQGLSRTSVRALLRDRKGTLWIGTDAGLNAWRDGRFSALTTKDGLPHDVVVALAEDRDGNLWVGTDGGGSARLREGRVSTFASAHGLSNDSILAIHEDREGNLWMGTNLGGLNQLRDGRVTPLGRREGLSHDYARAVYEDRDGALWFGTEGGGLDRLQHGRITSHSTRNGLSNDTVFAIVQDRAGDLWVGTDHGLNRHRGGRFESFHAADTHSTPGGRPHGDDGMSNDSVLALLEGRDGSIWIGTYAGGLNRYKDGRFTALTTRQGLAHDTVNVLYEDRAGALWIGTRGGGLDRLVDGRIEHFTTRNGLSDDLVFALHEDAEGALWIGTYGGGLNRYKDGRFSAVTRRQGLHDDVVHHILEDGFGYVWLSGNRGVSRVSKRELDEVADGRRPTLAATVLGTADGMRDTECNGGASAGARTRSGHLWFPTVEGFVEIDPARLRASSAPPVVIESALVDAQAMPVHAAFAVAPGARTLSFQFTALSFVAPGALRFRYQLEGLDEDWVDAGTRRTTSYSRLPPGRYAFRVSAAGQDGAWSAGSAPLVFEVLPLFYETWWFRGLAVAVLAVAWPLFYRARIRRLQRQKEELEHMVADRTADLNAANARLEQLARVDGLTGLFNRRAFDELLEGECRRAVRQQSELALLMLDVDAFKAYNDRYGHPAGDACLRTVAETVRRTLRRAGDVAARYGGEEIVVVLPGTALEAALAVAESIRAAVEDLALPHVASPVQPTLTVSVGAAATGGRPLTPAELVADADAALYAAKQAGRNRVESAAPLRRAAAR